MSERLATAISSYAAIGLHVLLLLLAAWAVYGDILQHEFLQDWDDHIYVTANEHILGFTRHNLKVAFTSLYMGNYAPLQMLSYMLDFTLWGLNPAGFKLTNLVLHAANGAAFYLLVLRLTGKALPACLSALIFLCHPVQVESVAWISQRKNLLAMLFFLITLHLYRNWNRSRTPGNRHNYWWALATFLLSLLAKPVTVIFPLVMATGDVCFHRDKTQQETIRDLRPFIAVAGVFAMLSFFFQSPEYQGGKTSYHGGSPLATLYTMLIVLMKYLKLLVWPGDLSAGYYIRIITRIDARVAAAFLALLLMVGLGRLLFRHNKEKFFWYALFFFGLLPVSQIVPLVTMMNDRYLYFPMLGAAPFVVGSFGALPFPRLRPLFLGLLALAVIPLSLAARERTAVWRNSLTLWEDTTQKMPGAAIAWAGLGNACLNAGRTAEAVGHYRRALALDPANRIALSNLSLIEDCCRQRQGAEEGHPVR